MGGARSRPQGAYSREPAPDSLCLRSSYLGVYVGLPLGRVGMWLWSGEEVPELGPYARWEELPSLPVATPVHHHHRQQQLQHQGGGDEAHAAAGDRGGAARGGVDEWSVCWAQFAQPADDPALERQLLRQVHRPRPARGWTAAAQSVCTFPPPVRSLVLLLCLVQSGHGARGTRLWHTGNATRWPDSR